MQNHSLFIKLTINSPYGIIRKNCYLTLTKKEEYNKIIIRFTHGQGHVNKILTALEKAIEKKVAESFVKTALELAEKAIKENTPVPVTTKLTPEIGSPIAAPKPILQQLFGNIKSVNPHTIKPVVAIPPYVQQNKETANTFLQKCVSENDPLNPQMIQEFMIKLPNTNPPAGLSRMGQIMPEILFCKVKFVTNDVQSGITYCQIIDISSKNNGITDISTVQNIGYFKYLFEIFESFAALHTRVVIPTYLSHEKPYTLSQETLDFIEKSKKYTGNTFSDAVLSNIPFHFKPLPALTKNHIAFVTAENSDEIRKFYYAFHKHLLILLNQMEHDKSLDIFAKSTIFNELAFKNMTEHDRISIIIPNTREPFIPSPKTITDLAAFNIPTNKQILHTPAIKKAVFEFIDETFPDDDRIKCAKNFYPKFKDLYDAKYLP